MALFDMTASTNVRKLMVLNPEYPKDVTVKSGADAVFSAVIEKDGRPTEYTYKWYVNDIPVDNVNTAVYTRKTNSDKGVYSVYCEITNKAGVVRTRTATMTVNALPKLDSSKPANGTAEGGVSKTLEITISEHGYPREYTYQWYKNGSKISGATKPSYDFVPETAETATFYCKVTNSAGTVTSRTATITVSKVFLYNNGNECTSITGGWQARGLKVRSDYDAATPTIVKGSNNVTISQSSFACGGVYEIAKDFDLTKFNTLTFDVTVGSEATGIFGLIVYDRSITSTGNSNVDTPFSNTITHKRLQFGDSGSFSIDVSGVNRAACIGIAVYNWITGTTPYVIMKKCVVT